MSSSRILIATKNVPMAPDYKNVVRFVNGTHAVTNDPLTNLKLFFQENYFVHPTTGAAILLNMAFYNEVNFDYGDGIITKVVYDITKLAEAGMYGYDKALRLALSSNYMVVLPEGSWKTPNNTRFYFIKGHRQLNSRLVELDLELDIFTTYYDITTTQPIMIERKHCDRFEDKITGAGIGYYPKLDELIGGDDIENKFNATVPIEKIKQNIRYTQNAAINDKLNDTLWGYIWVSQGSPSGTVKETETQVALLPFSVPDKAQFQIQEVKFGSPRYNMYCYVAPLTRAQVKVNWQGGGGYIKKTWSFGQLYNIFYNQSQIVGVTISPFAPFKPDLAGGENVFDGFTIEDNLLTWDFGEDLILDSSINSYGGTTSNLWYYGNVSPHAQFNWMQRRDGIIDPFFIQLQYLRSNWYVPTFQFNVPFNFPFLTTMPSYDEPLHIDWEPKLWVEPFSKLRATALWSEGKDYSMALLDSNIMRLEVNTLPFVAGQKIGLILAPRNSSWVSKSPYKQNRENHIMENTNISYALATSTNALQEYWTTQAAQSVGSLATPVISGGLATILQGAGLTIPGIGWAGLGIATLSQGISFGAKQIDLSRTPDTIKVTGVDGYFDMTVDEDLKPYITHYGLINNERKQVAEYFINFGWRVNRQYTWNELFGRTRFNYVQMKDPEFKAKVMSTQQIPLSPAMKEKLEEILERGTTFWNIWSPTIPSGENEEIGEFYNSILFNKRDYENLEWSFDIF
jgi:hypothetical protein